MRRPIRVGDFTVLDQTGDDDALTYGGGVIFRRDGDTCWEFWDPPTTKTYMVWRAKIPVNVLRAYKSVDRKGIARHAGVDQDTLRTMSTGNRVSDRLALLMAIIELEGRSRVCPLGPREMTRHELVQRWGPLYKVDPDTFPRYDSEDFIISEFEEGFACGQIVGRFLGVYETFECCAAAIAEDMEANDLGAHVYVEGLDGSLEKLEWSRRRWLGQPRERIRIGFAKSTWRFRMRAHAKEAAKTGRKLTKAERAVDRRIRGTMPRSRT
jgi:hypothetical protein